MTDNVISLVKTPEPELSPDDVLEAAKGQLENVVVLGENKDGTYWVSASLDEISEVVLHIEVAKRTLLDALYE